MRCWNSGRGNTSLPDKAICLLVLLILCAALVLPACSPDGQDKYNLVIRTNGDVNRFSLDTEHFTFFFYNGSDYSISTGQDYSLEERKGLVWVKSDATTSYVLPNYGLEPGMSSPVMVLLNGMPVQEHPLVAGHYRVRKDVTVNGEEVSAYFEFDMFDE